jgi:hypothetical protein
MDGPSLRGVEPPRSSPREIRMLYHLRKTLYSLSFLMIRLGVVDLLVRKRFSHSGIWAKSYV